MRKFIAAGLLSAIALAGCASAKTRTITRTVTATVTAAAPATTQPVGAPVSAVSSAALPATPVLSGSDTKGAACSTLTTSDVEQATGNTVVKIMGVPNPVNHSDTCTWYLGPVPTCDCGQVGVTVQWHVSSQLATAFEKQWMQDMRQRQATTLPGIKNGELRTTTTGLSGSATFVKPGLWVTVSSRMGYTWVPADKLVLLATVPLVYPRAKAGKDKP
jgi:hypothetical protein